MWAKVRPELARLGIEVTEHLTTRAGQATEITRRALNREFNCVVAVGGDGTLNEVVNGYLNEAGQAVNSSATLGLLPSGTGSDFGRSLGLRTYRDFIRAVAASSTRWVDVVRVVFRHKDGSICSRFFSNAATFGLGADAAALVNQWREVLPTQSVCLRVPIDLPGEQERPHARRQHARAAEEEEARENEPEVIEERG